MAHPELGLPRAAVSWTAQKSCIAEEEAAHKEAYGPDRPKIWRTEPADPRTEMLCFLGPPLDCSAFLEGEAFLSNSSEIKWIQHQIISADFRIEGLRRLNYCHLRFLSCLTVDLSS